MESQADSVRSDWSDYSWGLYYKHRALRARDAAERTSYLDRSIERLTRAAASGVSPGQVNLQLSDCHFNRKDYGKALEYARVALATDRTDLRIYNIMYSSYLKLRDLEGAAEILREYLGVRPDSVQVLFILAEHYNKNMHDAGKAAPAYRAVIDISNRQPVDDYYKEQSYFNLAGMAYRGGDIAGAASLYAETLSINKENLEALYYLTLTSMEKYDLDSAMRNGLLFLGKQPDDPVINSVLGRVYYLRTDLHAIRHLGRARVAGSINGILSLGLYHELTGNDRAAEKLLDNVLKFSPNTISLHLALARINERKGDATAAFNEYVTAGVLMYNARLYEEAIRSLLEAARLNSSVAGVYYYLAKSYEDSRHLFRAIYYYIKANELQKDADLMLHIGYLYGVKKEYALATRYFNGASSLEPKNARPYFFKGLISIWQEDYPAAESHIRRAISFDDTSETYYFYFAVVMDKLSRPDLAIDSLEKAIRHNPQSGRAYNFLGYIFADRNMHLERSVELIRKALELEPDNGAYIDSLGWAYYRKGEYALALEKLLAAEEILRKSEAPDPVVYDHIGDAYMKMGRLGDAVIYWEKSVDMKRDDLIEKKIQQHKNRR